MEIAQLLYIDPAATSVLLTSLTAIIVAVGASAIVIWRKFKKKVDKSLNKDPNANKEVEADLIITDEEAKPDEAPASEDAASRETPEAPAADTGDNEVPAEKEQKEPGKPKKK